MNAKAKERTQNSAAGRWVGFRKEIKVLDCTIRDGGLMNDSNFEDGTVKAVYDACVASGVDYMEIGYKNSRKIFAPSKYGPWRRCDEDDLRRIVGDNNTDLKLSVMADAEKCDYKSDILPKKDSVLDLIRVATYIHQLPLAIDMIKDATDKGYETCVNIMAISTVREQELDEALEMLCETPVQTIYLVDSFGSLYSEQINYLARKYLKYAKAADKQVGIHAHNNLQLAYANTIEAIVRGVNMLDATMAGLGRGAGNCPLELLIGFLHNPKYMLRPILECIQNNIEPMREKLGWGFDYSYMMTGLLNRHPRSAMAHNDGPDKKDILGFYDQTMREI